MGDLRAEEMVAFAKDGLTLEEIGRQYDLSRQRVQQILKRAGYFVRRQCALCPGTTQTTSPYCSDCNIRRRAAARKLSRPRARCIDCRRTYAAHRVTIRICSDGERRCSACAYHQDPEYKQRVAEATRCWRQKTLADPVKGPVLRRRMAVNKAAYDARKRAAAMTASEVSP